MTEDLAAALYEVDPANTNCQAEEALDEYLFDAGVISRHVKAGQTLSEAIAEVLGQRFESEIPHDKIAKVVSLVESREVA